MDMKIPVIKVDFLDGPGGDSADGSNGGKDIKKEEAIHNEDAKYSAKQSNNFTSPFPANNELSSGMHSIKIEKAAKKSSGNSGNMEPKTKLKQLTKSEIHSMKLEGSVDESPEEMPSMQVKQQSELQGNVQNKDAGITKSGADLKLQFKKKQFAIHKPLFPMLVDDNDNSVNALVSPLLMRRYRNNDKRISVDILPRNGVNLIEITALSQPKSPKLPQRVKSDWVCTENSKNIHSPKETSIPYHDSVFRDSLRKSRFSLDSNAPKPRSRKDSLCPNEQRFLRQNRPRSRSVSQEIDKEATEAMEVTETYIKPSRHWCIAKDYMTAKSLRLPDIVQLYQKHRTALDPQKTSEGIAGPSLHQKQIEDDKIPNKKKEKLLVKSRSEEFFGTTDDEDEIMYQKDKRSMSLQERLEAIERQYGIVHNAWFEELRQQEVNKEQRQIEKHDPE